LLARGARKVYADARDPAAVIQSGVQPMRPDVTKSDEVGGNIFVHASQLFRDRDR
jgi:hypothetical protein